MNRAENDVVVGALPDGRIVYASHNLIGQFGTDKVREELVDAAWVRAGMDPPGYHRIRTSPFNDNYILIRAKSPEDALKKYLIRRSRSANRERK